MNNGLNSLFDGLALLFIILSVVVCLVALLWVSGTVAVPGSIAPKTAIPIPTLGSRPTLAPEGAAPTTPADDEAPNPADNAPPLPPTLTPTPET